MRDSPDVALVLLGRQGPRLLPEGGLGLEQGPQVLLASLGPGLGVPGLGLHVQGPGLLREVNALGAVQLRERGQFSLWYYIKYE